MDGSRELKVGERSKRQVKAGQRLKMVVLPSFSSFHFNAFEPSILTQI